jgi:hypothetical protein
LPGSRSFRLIDRDGFGFFPSTNGVAILSASAVKSIPVAILARVTVGFGVCALSGMGLSVRADETNAVVRENLWTQSVTLRTWSGYKDNVLLGASNPIQSGLTGGSAEWVLWRPEKQDWEYLILASGDYVRYWAAGAVDKEITAFAQAQAKRRLDSVWTLGAALETLYFDQVFDNSIFATEVSSIQVRGHTLTLRPTLRAQWESKFYVEGEAAATREIFRGGLDDEWQGATKLSLGREYGHRSDVRVSYGYTRRIFDTREPRNVTALFERGRSLVFDQQEWLLHWRHYWEARRRWRTTTRLSWLRNGDNGAGYYDFDRARVSLELLYRLPKWEALAEIRLSRFDYEWQPVDLLGGAVRERTLLQAKLRAEYEIYRSWRLFAEWEYERSTSNVAFDEYRAQTMVGGVGLDF